MSGKLEKNAAPEAQSLYRPRRGGASRDTQLMYEYSHRIQEGSDLEFASRRFLWNRDQILSTFRDNYSSLTPRQWLLFQTACTEKFDVFKDTLRICLLITPRYREEPSLPNRMFLDEAQCDLEENDQCLDRILHGMTGFNYRAQWSLSGTSLKLNKCKPIVDQYSERFENNVRTLRSVVGRSEKMRANPKWQGRLDRITGMSCVARSPSKKSDSNS